MRKFAIFLIMIIAAVSVFSGCSNVSPVVVTGTVRGAQAKTVIAGATVTATGKNTYATVTEIDGTYRLMLPPGTYNITAAYETFNKAAATITVTDKPVTKDLTLTTGSQTALAFPKTFTHEYYLQTSPYGTGARAVPASEGRKTVLTNLNIRAQKSPPEGYCYYLGLYAEFDLTEPISYSGYRIYTSRSAEGPFTLICTGLFDPESFSVVRVSGDFHSLPLLDYTECYFAMQLYSPDGETPLTEAKLFPPLAPLTLTAPAHQTEYTTDDTITLEWSDEPACDLGYDVLITQKYTSPSGDIWMFEVDYHTSENSQSVSGLSPGIYAWSVRGTDYSYTFQRDTVSAYRIFVVKPTSP